jgi:hypothetical protein
MENCRQFWEGALKTGITLRNDDSLKRYFRSNRFYNREDKWFIHTRETEDKGPFENLSEAKKFLKTQIITQQTRK